MKRVRIVFCCAALLLIITSSAAFGESKDSIRLSFPKLKWCLEIAAPDFVLQQKEFDEEKNIARFLALNPDTGIIMSGTIEKVDREGDAKACRDYYWGKRNDSGIEEVDVEMSEMGKMTLLEYWIKDPMGIPIKQKHIHAFLTQGRYWMNVHLFKGRFEPEDEASIQALLQGITVHDQFVKSTYRVRYGVPEHGALVLDVPGKWRDTVDYPRGGIPPTITVETRKTDDLVVKILPLWSVNGEKDFNSEENVKILVEETIEEMLPSAEEEAISMEPLKGEHARGFYFFITDKAPKSGEHKYVTNCVLGVGDLLLTCSILTHKKKFKEIDEALEMLRNIEQVE